MMIAQREIEINRVEKPLHFKILHRKNTIVDRLIAIIIDTVVVTEINPKKGLTDVEIALVIG